jgi:hypothetical protein
MGASICRGVTDARGAATSSAGGVAGGSAGGVEGSSADAVESLASDGATGVPADLVRGANGFGASCSFSPPHPTAATKSTMHSHQGEERILRRQRCESGSPKLETRPSIFGKQEVQNVKLRAIQSSSKGMSRRAFTPLSLRKEHPRERYESK